MEADKRLRRLQLNGKALVGSMSGAWTALCEGSRALLSALRTGKFNAERRLHGLIKLSELAGVHTAVILPKGKLGGQIFLRKGGTVYADISSLEPAVALDIIAQFRIEGMLVSDERKESL